MQAVIVRNCLISSREPTGPGLAPFRTLTQFMQVIYSCLAGQVDFDNLSKEKEEK